VAAAIEGPESGRVFALREEKTLNALKSGVQRFLFSENPWLDQGFSKALAMSL
jgi:hypothetical protein